MEAKFLTPIQLWKDFNPIKDSLDLSYVKSEIVNGFIRKGAYYTSETVSDGKARIFAEIVAPDDNKKKPVIIVIGDIKETINIGLLEYVASCGYIAASYDYSGISTNREYFSKYPESLSYAEYSKAISNLNRAENSAMDTCWYVWAKAARRLLSVIAQDNQADINNIGVIGIKHGALIMWQLAAMDGRVKAAASVIGNEGMLYQGKFKYSPNSEIELDESRVNWRAAISSEAYARFIGCPILMATATNNSISSFDRIEDIKQLIPETTPYAEVMSVRLTNQITDTALSTIRKWFNTYLKKGVFVNNPELKYEVINGKLVISLNADETKKIKNVYLYYSYGELDPSFRNWISIEMIRGENCYEVSIDIYNSIVRHFMFGSVVYSESIELSTSEITFIPNDLGISGMQTLRQRIIYDNSKGIDAFTIRTESLVIDEKNPHIGKCPMGISGITTSEGSLITYKIGDLRCYSEEDSILQLDACSKENMNIELILLCKEDGAIKKYSSSYKIEGDEEWHKLSFAPQDFKTSELIPLKNWQGVKKLEIRNAQNILFNNIIWV